jgi:hypothetical protein
LRRTSRRGLLRRWKLNHKELNPVIPWGKISLPPG